MSGTSAGQIWEQNTAELPMAEPGDRNPYAGRSLVLAKLWRRGYHRMLHVRIYTGPAMQTHLRARAAAELSPGTPDPT